MKGFLKNILNEIFPLHCLICQTRVMTNLALCDDCFKELPWNNFFCERCGISLENTQQIAEICGDCLVNPPCYRQIIAPFKYQPPLTNFITGLKFQHQLHYANLLGRLLAQYLRAKQISLPSMLIPIPLHRKRWCERGFNQAYEIARPISKILKIPIDLSLCERIKNTTAQSSLSARERAQNIKNAFQIKKIPPAKHIVLIDDVVTTGSTVNEITRVMHQSGVEIIDIWCCARANF